jgi:hypothetical protein
VARRSRESREKELRCEGYDIARKRVHRWLMSKARNGSARDNQRFSQMAEYVGIMLADYEGEPSAEVRRG